MDARRTYKGYELIDLSTVVGSGRYRARVAVVPESAVDTRNRRFFDFETYASMDAARLRAIDGAVCWIDEELCKKQPSMPPASADFNGPRERADDGHRSAV